MGDVFSGLTEKHRAFIEMQKMFFVATGCGAGRINLSPKGVDTFRCVNTGTIAYLDLAGSGSETSAHLLADGRITVMFCSFGAKPLIMRLYGQGRAVRPGDADWSEWSGYFDSVPGQRQVIVVSVESVQTSCGFGIPLYTYDGARETLVTWAEKKGADGIAAYQSENNRVSLDGLPTGLYED